MPLGTNIAPIPSLLQLHQLQAAHYSPHKLQVVHHQPARATLNPVAVARRSRRLLWRVIVANHPQLSLSKHPFHLFKSMHHLLVPVVVGNLLRDLLGRSANRATSHRR